MSREKDSTRAATGEKKKCLPLSHEDPKHTTDGGSLAATIRGKGLYKCVSAAW